jgi:hypothetical protein
MGSKEEIGQIKKGRKQLSNLPQNELIGITE